MTTAKPIEDRIERIPFSGCWIWMGHVKDNGYGGMSKEGRNRRAHVVIYEQYNGPVQDGLQLDHLCRVRCCVNPSHLEPVTQKENTAP